MVGDRYKKRAKSRKRDFEREKHEWSDDNSNSDVEEEHFVSQRKMRKASKEEGGEKRVEKKKQTFENPKCGPNKKKKARKNFEKVQNEEISKQIEHDEAEQWFTIDLPGGQGQAFLQYSIEDDGKIDLWHTEVRNKSQNLVFNTWLSYHALIAPRYLKQREVQGLEVNWRRQPLTGQQGGKEIKQKVVAIVKC